MTVKRKSVLLLVTYYDENDVVTLGEDDEPLPDPIAEYNGSFLYRIPEGTEVNAAPDNTHFGNVFPGMVVLSGESNVLLELTGGSVDSFKVFGESMSIVFDK